MWRRRGRRWSCCDRCVGCGSAFPRLIFVLGGEPLFVLNLHVFVLTLLFLLSAKFVCFWRDSRTNRYFVLTSF